MDNRGTSQENAGKEPKEAKEEKDSKGVKKGTRKEARAPKEIRAEEKDLHQDVGTVEEHTTQGIVQEMQKEQEHSEKPTRGKDIRPWQQ